MLLDLDSPADDASTAAFDCSHAIASGMARSSCFLRSGKGISTAADSLPSSACVSRAGHWLAVGNGRAQGLWHPSSWPDVR